MLDCASSGVPRGASRDRLPPLPLPRLRGRIHSAVRSCDFITLLSRSYGRGENVGIACLFASVPETRTIPLAAPLCTLATRNSHSSFLAVRLISLLRSPCLLPPFLVLCTPSHLTRFHSFSPHVASVWCAVGVFCVGAQVRVLSHATPPFSLTVRPQPAPFTLASRC